MYVGTVVLHELLCLLLGFIGIHIFLNILHIIVVITVYLLVVKYFLDVNIRRWMRCLRFATFGVIGVGVAQVHLCGLQVEEVVDNRLTIELILNLGRVLHNLLQHVSIWAHFFLDAL